MTLLDERTREQLHNLANVVTEYTNPGAVTYEAYTPPDNYDWRKFRLTRKQADRACYLRRMYQWHSNTIAEAMGLATASDSRNYQPTVTAALEECSQRDTWNNQGWRLGPQEITFDGHATYSKARQSLMRDAMARVVTANPTMRSQEIAIQAKRIVDTWEEDGVIVKAPTALTKSSNITRIINDLVELGFVWEGAGRTQIIKAMSEEMRKKIEAEIIRRCTADVEAFEDINTAKIARDISNNFEVEPGLTIVDLGWPPFSGGYVNRLCQEKGIIGRRNPSWRPQAESIADKQNIANVKAVMDANPLVGYQQIVSQTGLTREVVWAIQDNLGGKYRRTPGQLGTADEYETVTSKIAEGHANGLTPLQILEQYSEVREYYARGVQDKGRIRRGGSMIPRQHEELVIDYIQRSLRETPHTTESQEAQARIPIVAEQIKEEIERYLGQAEVVEEPLFGQTDPPYMIRWDNIENLTTRLWQERPTTVREAVIRLANTNPRFILLRGTEIHIPPHTQNRVRRGDYGPLNFV